MPLGYVKKVIQKAAAVAETAIHIYIYIDTSFHMPFHNPLSYSYKYSITRENFWILSFVFHVSLVVVVNWAKNEHKTEKKLSYNCNLVTIYSYTYEHESTLTCVVYDCTVDSI